jgi:outer membrane murein-binding lipoprotein Lpp
MDDVREAVARIREQHAAHEAGASARIDQLAREVDALRTRDRDRASQISGLAASFETLRGDVQRIGERVEASERGILAVLAGIDARLTRVERRVLAWGIPVFVVVEVATTLVHWLSR